MLSNLSETLQCQRKSKNKHVTKIEVSNSKDKNLAQQCSLQKIWKILLLKKFIKNCKRAKKLPICAKKFVKVQEST